MEPALNVIRPAMHLAAWIHGDENPHWMVHWTCNRPAVVAHSDRLANRHDGQLAHNTDCGCGGASGGQGPSHGHTQQRQLQRCIGHKNVAAQSIQCQWCLHSQLEVRRESVSYGG